MKQNTTNHRDTVRNLRQSGFKVRVSHYRYVEGWPDYLLSKEIREEGMGNFALSKGGKTSIELTKDGIDAKGEAICSPKDNYNRKLGVKIALGRALVEWQTKKSWPCMPQDINLVDLIKSINSMNSINIDSIKFIDKLEGNC